MNHAFIGISLDNKIFMSDLFIIGLRKIITKHDSVLILIADDLLRYTRTSDIKTKSILNFKKANTYIDNRRKVFVDYLNISIANFSQEDRNKIQVCKWLDFEDYIYSDILRNLNIAYYNIDSFKADILKLAEEHFKKNFSSIQHDKIIDASVQYILDEIAMALRLAEKDKYIYEYYPGLELPILKTLYSGKYKKFGLSIENLFGQLPQRKFDNLLNL